MLANAFEIADKRFCCFNVGRVLIVDLEMIHFN